MDKVKLVVRILLGLLLIVVGLNKFLQFMPMPPLPEEAGAFMGALMKTGYMMPFIAVIEIISGVLLLLNKYQALALVLVFPVLLNAFLFHIFLAPSGIAMAIMAIAMNIFLFYTNKDSYAALLNP